MLKVMYSPLAGEQVRALQQDGDAKPDHAQGKRWKGIRRVLVEYLPEHGLNPSHLKRHEFSGIRAMHVGARDRVVWIASADKSTVIVLMLGFVKEGDKEDTYKVLSKHIDRGTFDNQFAELELPKPGETKPPPRASGIAPVASDATEPNDASAADASPAESRGAGEETPVAAARAN